MNIRNTHTTYGTVTKWLHWLTAFLFIISYLTIYFREWFAISDRENWYAIQLHFSVGLTLAVLVVLRIFWRLIDKPPRVNSKSQKVANASRILHGTLYLIMIIMPLSGYLSKADYFICGKGQISLYFFYDLHRHNPVALCDIVNATLSALSQPADIIHQITGAWLIIPLLALHIAAALYHHFVVKDDTLLKMTTFKQIK